MGRRDGDVVDRAMERRAAISAERSRDRQLEYCAR